MTGNFDDNMRKRRSSKRRRDENRYICGESARGVSFGCSRALLGLVCLWLAPTESSGIELAASASDMGVNHQANQRANYLRNIHDGSPLPTQSYTHPVTQYSSSAYHSNSLSSLSSPHPRLLQEEPPPYEDLPSQKVSLSIIPLAGNENPTGPGSNSSADAREEAMANVLTQFGYNTAFGEEPLCWQSIKEIAAPDFVDSSIFDAYFAFPNPLVDDFPFIPRDELLYSNCWNNSQLRVIKPVEAIRGERLRVDQVYNYTVSLTLDFESILNMQEDGNSVGDSVVTFYPNVSQVAVQIMHCVLGKSGVCIPFLHEQAYLKEYLETGVRPVDAMAGTAHGRTHVHSNFTMLTLEPNQPILDTTFNIPLQVNMEGDYFVIAAVQFYTGDAATNVAYYRWDMANSMANQDRIVSYLKKPIIQRVSSEVLYLSYAIIAAASLVIAFLIYQAIKHRKEQVLTLSQGDFLIVFLFSALTATICTFLLEPKNALYCRIGSSLVLLPVQLMYAITAGRLWRINAVISPLLVEHMRQKNKWTTRYVGVIDKLSHWVSFRGVQQQDRDLRRSIPKWQLAVVVGMFMFPQVLLQIVELIWQPQELVLEYDIDESVGRYICQTTGTKMGSTVLLYSFLVLLILIAIVLFVAYSSRKLPSLFSETQVIFDSTFISVGMILLGFGVIGLTDAPTTSPDVQYLVWIAVTLSITLNSAFRIMFPKLKMIWKGEQVIVSKLVSDHHRKRREKDFMMNQKAGGDIMHNVTGIGADYDFSHSARHWSTQLSTQSNRHIMGAGSTSESQPSTHSESRPTQLFPQVSTGDLTMKASNMDEAEVPENRDAETCEGGHVDEATRLNAIPEQNGDFREEEMKANKTSKDSNSSELDKSMELDELNKQQPTSKVMGRKRASSDAANDVAPSSLSPQRDDTAVSDTETIGSKTGGHRRWSPLVRDNSRSDENKSQKIKRRSLSMLRPLTHAGETFRLALTKKGEIDKSAGAQSLKEASQRRRKSAGALLPQNRSPPRARELVGGSVRGRPERMKVAPDETPARRLVLKMIDLQEQLSSVTNKIVSGLQVAPDDWDLLTSLNEKLHIMFEKDVDFTWREPIEPPQASEQSNPPLNHSRGNNLRGSSRSNDGSSRRSTRSQLSTESRGRDLRSSGRSNDGSGKHPTQDHPPTNVRGDREVRGSEAEKLPSQITLQQNKRSPPVSPKRERRSVSPKREGRKVSLRRGSVTKPAVVAVSFRNIVDVRDRRRNLVKHKKCFVGRDAVDSLVYSGLAASREEAVQIGRAMVKDMHLFKTVNGSLEFDDDDRLYRFIDLDDCWSSSDEEDEPESTNFSSLLDTGPNLVDKANDFRETVLTKDCMYRMQTFKDVFVGAEAVDSLVYAGVAITRWEAVQLGRRLARELHLFSHITNDHDFQDDFLFYRYKPDDDQSFHNLSSQFLDSIAEISDLPGEQEDSLRNDLADKADAFRIYVDARHRRYRMQLLKDVFVGSEAIDSLVFAGVASSRDEAVDLGNTLMTELRLFTPVKGEQKFSDKRHSYYRFNDSHLKRRHSVQTLLANSKTADEVTLAELKSLGEVFQTIVEVQDRTYRFRKYRNCFVGAEAVDEMVSNGMAETRDQAVQIGRAMARELDLFKHVSIEKPFSDDYVFYQFCDNDQSSSSLMSDGPREMSLSVSRRPSANTLKYLQDTMLDSSNSLNEEDRLQFTPNSMRSSARSNASNDVSLLDSAASLNFDFGGDSLTFNGSVLEIVPELGESKSGELQIEKD